MKNEFKIKYNQTTFEKNPALVIIYGVIGCLLFLLSFVFFDLNLNQLYMIILSFIFFSIFMARIAIYFYKSDILRNHKKMMYVEISKENKRAEVLLEVGDLCSWQFSLIAGILKLDSSTNKILGSTKTFYTLEELIRNRDIRRVLNRVRDLQLTAVDDEIYFPIINKWFIIRGRCVDTPLDGNPNQFIGIILDNTERRRIQKQLEILSVTDALTGLKNRRSFFDALQYELNQYKRTNKPFSIAMIDLDFFKKINDTYGHLSGDHILKEFSKVLEMDVRPYDLVARFGGEEFVILFPGIDKSEAVGIISRIRKRVLDTILVFDDKEIPYTFSCGIGDSSEVGDYTEKTFISIIDTRLYDAKRQGRNLIITGE